MILWYRVVNTTYYVRHTQMIGPDSSYVLWRDNIVNCIDWTKNTQKYEYLWTYLRYNCYRAIKSHVFQYKDIQDVSKCLTLQILIFLRTCFIIFEEGIVCGTEMLQ